MFMLRETAHKHGLEIMPYHWMWCSNIAEATLAADIANYFDGCCPDIEDPFNNQPGWALEYGKVIRQRPHHRLFHPTLYANPQQHADQPYAQYEQWIDGWMPMVYFSEWREAGLPMTAQEAIDFVFPQWKALDASCVSQGIAPKPILPLIEVGDHLPVQEAVNWLNLAGGYGYCGFWWDGVYAPYADAVKAAPMPALKAPEPPKPIVYEPPALVGPGLTEDEGDIVMHQQLSEDQLRLMYHITNPTIPFDLSHGIPSTWATLVQKYPLDYIGSPKSVYVRATIDGQEVTMVEFTSGHKLIYFKADNAVRIL